MAPVVTAVVLQIHESDVEIKLAADADRKQACTPTDTVREALAKIDGLMQCWRAAKQDAQVFYVSVVL